MIPKVIYILHESMKETLMIDDKWRILHPEYTINIVDMDNYKSLLKPLNPIYLEVFRAIKWPSIKTDFMRLVLLYEKGGFVMDSNLEPLHNFDPLCNNHLILCKSMEEFPDLPYCKKCLAGESNQSIVKTLMYYYINNFFNGNDFSRNWELEKIMKQFLPNSMFGTSVGIIQQQSSRFFYDASYAYKKIRILNDKSSYFRD